MEATMGALSAGSSVLAVPAVTSQRANNSVPAASLGPSLSISTQSQRAAFPSRNSSSRRGVACAAADNDAVVIATEETADPSSESDDVAAFLSDVTSLVKLVDSRDIVELELKHSNFEIVIRKNAPPPPAPPAQAPAPPQFQPLQMGAHIMAHSAAAPPPPPPPPPAPVAAAPAAAPAAPKPAAAPAASGIPLLSPMAGTFYRSPGPGEPPFVKVGDRVNKGQVVCIVEAMKLMNEIEADQSGTIAQIVAADGKPVSIESPLFLIEP